MCACPEPLPTICPWHPLWADVGVQIAAWHLGLGGTRERESCASIVLRQSCACGRWVERTLVSSTGSSRSTDLVRVMPDCTVHWRKSTRDCAGNLQATVELGVQSKFPESRWVPNIFSLAGASTLLPGSSGRLASLLPTHLDHIWGFQPPSTCLCSGKRSLEAGLLPLSPSPCLSGWLPLLSSILPWLSSAAQASLQLSVILLPQPLKC